MATYTGNYNLKKPAGAEDINIADINGNMDIIDTTMKSTNDKLKYLTGAYSTSLTDTNIGSDTAVCDMDNGVYRVSIGASNTAFPERVGTVSIMKSLTESTTPYCMVLFASTTGKAYIRHASKASSTSPWSWATGWLIISAEESANAGSISASNSVTITFSNNICIVALSRINQSKAVLLLFDYWSENYSVIGGTFPSSGITIAKSSSSNSITITNSLSYVIAYKIMR